MPVSRETTLKEAARELPLFTALAAGPPGDCDPELIYEQLVSHAAECRICWLWRNQLWAVHRLCPTGAGLADRYAVAEARRGERE
ncbi:MAG: hypothetical protein M3072_07320 [Candidatus Dormibacteraeota bacterium]|nr:hypothetical protein [Candidatus Dormibacteraeota bacterium]